MFILWKIHTPTYFQDKGRSFTVGPRQSMFQRGKVRSPLSFCFKGRRFSGGPGYLPSKKGKSDISQHKGEAPFCSGKSLFKPIEKKSPLLPLKEGILSWPGKLAFKRKK